ncbi:MAG TPA: tetratricopeptide repeat protein [Bacteroidales bacterium]|nr:tetratricopeptide repeat protein [Bacteroidales bacterium]
MSQREIFDLAQSRDDKDLLKIAAIYFPNNVIANINASSVALVRGSLDEAWTYLSKVEVNPEAYNNLGIYYWLRGDVESAKDYFEKAMVIDSQNENAVANMMLLEKY